MLEVKEKQDALILRWLQKATTLESMHVLSGVHVTENNIVACDRFNLHIAPRITSLPLPVGEIVCVHDGKPLRKSPHTYETEIVAGHYPETEAFESDVIAKPLQAAVDIDPEKLRNALEGFENKVTIEIRGDRGDPVRIVDKSGEFRALVMPCQSNTNESLAREAKDAQKVATWLQENHPDLYRQACK